MGVKLLGTPVEAIDRAEDRELFKEAMEKIGQPLIPSATATEVAGARHCRKDRLPRHRASGVHAGRRGRRRVAYNAEG